MREPPWCGSRSGYVPDGSGYVRDGSGYARDLVRSAKRDAPPLGAKSRAIARLAAEEPHGSAPRTLATVALAAAVASAILCARGVDDAALGGRRDAPPPACSLEEMVSPCADPGMPASRSSSGGGLESWSESSSG